MKEKQNDEMKVSLRENQNRFDWKQADLDLDDKTQRKHSVLQTACHHKKPLDVVIFSSKVKNIPQNANRIS